MLSNMNIYDEALLIRNDTTRLLVQRIVEDRKFDIPDEFYKYIDQDTLVSIIYGQNGIIIDKPFVEFVLKCIDMKVITSYRGFIVSLLDNDLIEYGFIINPKIFYRIAKSFIRQLTLNNIITIISNWIKFFSDESNSVPSQYVQLYIKVFRYIHGLKVDDIFPIHYSIIDNYLLPSIHSIRGSEGTDYLFATIWDMYCSKNSDLYDAYHDQSSLNWYWETFDGDFLPNNATLYDINSYLDIKLKTSNMKLNPKVKILMKRILKYMHIDNTTEGIRYQISNNVISSIVKCIDNIDLVYWNPNIVESNMFMTLFNKHPESLSNYASLYRLTGKLPKPDSIIKYIQAGNDYFGIKKYAEQVSQLDPELYVETVCLYTNDDTFTKVLLDKTPSPILKIHMTLFEFIMKKYVDKNTDERIKDRLKTIILNNPEFYKSGLLSHNRLLSLLDMNNQSLQMIASKYPKTLTYLGDTYHSYYIIKSIIGTQYDLIYYVPWKKLTTADIINEIRLNGYFPIVQDTGENLMINDFISGEDMYILISEGYGFGYILEYELSDYVKILLSTAIKYIEK